MVYLIVYYKSCSCMGNLQIRVLFRKSDIGEGLYRTVRADCTSAFLILGAVMIMTPILAGNKLKTEDGGGCPWITMYLC